MYIWATLHDRLKSWVTCKKKVHKIMLRWGPKRQLQNFNTLWQLSGPKVKNERQQDYSIERGQWGGTEEGDWVRWTQNRLFAFPAFIRGKISSAFIWLSDNSRWSIFWAIRRLILLFVWPRHPHNQEVLWNWSSNHARILNTKDNNDDTTSSPCPHPNDGQQFKRK